MYKNEARTPLLPVQSYVPSDGDADGDAQLARVHPEADEGGGGDPELREDNAASSQFGRKATKEQRRSKAQIQMQMQMQMQMQARGKDGETLHYNSISAP
jgi:hypothetical protein